MNSFIEKANEFIEYNSSLFIVILLGMLIVLFILHFVQLKKFKNYKDRYNSLTRGLSGANIEDLFGHINANINSLNRDINILEDNIVALENKLSFAIQKIGFVRYNAFGDMGSELSFSLAMLDNYNNGFLLTGIYGRDSSVSFAKPIKNGKTNIPLSPEEILALDRALRGENKLAGIQLEV